VLPCEHLKTSPVPAAKVAVFVPSFTIRPETDAPKLFESDGHAAKVLAPAGKVIVTAAAVFATWIFAGEQKTVAAIVEETEYPPTNPCAETTGGL
jgi:hypothetical protein